MKLVFFCYSSWQQRKSLDSVKYPYILVNYMSGVFTRPHYARILFVDCGGFSASFIHHGYPTSDIDYLRYVKRMNATMFALRDYPCHPEILKKLKTTVESQIQKTLDNHIRLLELTEDMMVTSRPVPVIQGWEVEDYLYCIDLFREHGLIFDYMAIGSLVRPNAQAVRKAIIQIRRALPNWVKLHGFGVKLNVIKYKDVYDALFSIDTGAWDLDARIKRWKTGGDQVTVTLELLKEYMAKIGEIRRKNERQTTLVSP